MLPNGPMVFIAAGYSHLQLDRTRFTTVTDFFTESVTDKVTDHDGRFDGFRVSGAFDGIARVDVAGRPARIGVKGFYAHYESTQNSRCTFVGAVSDCVLVPLIETSPTLFDISGGFLSDWTTRTRREVSHWGIGVEAKFTRPGPVGGSIEGAPIAVASPFVWHVGAAVKRFDQKIDLHSEDRGPTLDPVNLNERLDTTYYGAYIGFNLHQPVGNGFTLVIGGEGGAYYANTSYRGHYSASDTLDNFAISQALSLSDDRPAFIGGLNVELKKSLGRATVGLFAEAEWYSYAPTVQHNDFDRAEPAKYIDGRLDGTQDGTTLGDGSAFVYTLGGRVSVPLQ